MAYIDYYEFARTYTRNSLMLFDKYVSKEGIDIDEERTQFMNHYIYPLSRFLESLKSNNLIKYFFNMSFMKLYIVNDEDFIDKEFDRDYFAAMYLAKFTLDAYNNNFKEGTFGDTIASIIYFFDKGGCDIDELNELMNLGNRISYIYRDYIDNYVMKRRRRKMIRKDIENIYTQATDRFTEIISKWSKNISGEDDTEPVNIDKFKRAGSKLMSLIKTITLIEFETRLSIYSYDTDIKCNIYKDMWECKWDSSFNKVKDMNDFSFMFYKIYYWFVS